jgi:glycosyltransferase involved in cell wall biosynthesis
VRSVEPDVVSFQYVAHMYGRGGVAPWAALLPLRLRLSTAARVVCTLHELAIPWSARPRRAAQALAQRAQAAVLLLAAHRLLVTNPRYTSTLGRWPGVRARLHQVPVGPSIVPVAWGAEDRAAMRRWLGAERGVLLGDLSALSAHKRPDDLVAALAALGPHARLALLGGLAHDEFRKASLMARARDLGVEDRIVWTGYLPPERLSLALSALDVYVHTQDIGASTRSTTLATALAHGLPVVAYRGAETAPIFVDRENVLLVSSRAVPDLAAGIRQVLESADLRERLETGAQELYQRYFTWHSIARAFLQVAA